jgi:hypothetical protein
MDAAGKTLRGRQWAVTLLLCAGPWAASQGCAGRGSIDGDTAGNGGELQVWAEPLGVVQGHANSHLNSKAAESVVTTMGPSFEVTTSFNATDSTQFMTFNNNSRQVFANASLMGFTTMDSTGVVIASGRLRPPAGWSVLWGDPAITRSRSNMNRVYLTQLAVPTEKFNLSPTPGRIEGPLTANVPALCGAFVGGACIARSNDSGRTFSLAASDCVRRFEAGCTGGNFYDGAEIETSADGRVYAAYVDVRNAKIDVYMSTNETDGLARITTPPVSAASHPRLKWGPGGMYLLVQSGAGQLSITRYEGGASRTGSWTTPVVVTNQYSSGSISLPENRFIRVGPQYAFDVGQSEVGVDQIRIVFKAFENNHHHLRVYKCGTGSPIACQRVSQWETVVFNANADQFMPAIAFGWRTFAGSAWVATYFDTVIQPGGNRVNLMRSITLQNNSTFQIDRVTLENAQVPCPDTRGFWGDYDNMAFGAFGFFMRPFTDSSHSACTMNQFNSTPKVASLHMSAVQ